MRPFIASAALRTCCLLLGLPSLSLSHSSTTISSWEIQHTSTSSPSSPWLPARLGSIVGNLIMNNILLDPDLFPDSSPEDELDKPYYKDNLSKIPDVNVTGPDYYTYTWRPAPSCDETTYKSTLPYHHLELLGVGYRSTVYISSSPDGPMVPIGSTLGMWSRTVIDITSLFASPTFSLSSLRIVVSPPDNVGIPSSFCADRIDTTLNCGQGGDHELAKDAGAMQFAAGWDWVQGQPDRMTGIFDDVRILHSGAVRVEHSTVETLAVDDTTGGAELRFKTELLNVSPEDVVGTLVVTLTSPDGEDIVFHRSLPSLLVPSGSSSSNSGGCASSSSSSSSCNSLTVSFTALLPSVNLWWPHQLGSQPLYTARFSFGPSLDDAETVKVGVRSTSSYIHPVTGGQAFEVNNRLLFLQGGNWIATDALLRFSTDRERYGAAVRVHREAGLNLIRVWGGGLTERSAFYEAADEQGMLVFQEFWMSGDNNGRWGGEYNYPTHHDSYLRQARDMVYMVRSHPSLLFWGGGNELYPKGSSPPSDIADGLEAIMSNLDPTRFFIQSSMDGGVNGGDMNLHDPAFALAPKDGPYGFLPSSTYYSDPNPGVAAGVVIGFQPEVGGSSAPRQKSLRRMGLGESTGGVDADEDAYGGFPSFCDGTVPQLWTYHNYEGYCVGGSYDAVYAYGGRVDSVREWSVRALLAAHQQYQSLFEGFSLKMFGAKDEGGKTAVVMWKTLTPWPSLRGFLYDWYGDRTGTFDGVQAGTGGGSSTQHVVLDLSSLRPALINRGLETRGEGTLLLVDFFDRRGEHTGDTLSAGPLGTVGSMEVVRAGTNATWPERRDNETLFVRVVGEGGGGQRLANWYWLRDTKGGVENNYNFGDLGEWREAGPFPALRGSLRGGGKGKAHSPTSKKEGGDWEATLTLSVGAESSAIAFKPSLTLMYEEEELGLEEEMIGKKGENVYKENRVLPTFFGPTPTVVLPGESIDISVAVPKSALKKDRKIAGVLVELWAGEDLFVQLHHQDYNEPSRLSIN